MINKEFLKKLTILYVEDEDVAREQFGKSLRRLFKNVILAINGEDGYNKFKEAQSSKEPIDLILSDINMPKMDGLEMLEKIRKIDENVPVMYTTARTETEYLQRAIELNVNHYALKPINLEDIVVRIQKVCEKQYYQTIINSKNSELKNYLSIINQVSAIYKFNEKGEITFINNLLCDLFHDSKDSLVGKCFSELFHPHITEKTTEEIFSKIERNETWTGDIKYEDSQNEVFYVRSSIFKLVNENGFEGISIGFLSTADVERKREFHKSVLQTISSKNKEASKSKNDVISLSEENEDFRRKHNFYSEEIIKYQEKISFLKNQVNHYEDEKLIKEETVTNKANIRKQTTDNLTEEIDNLKKENRLLVLKNTQLEINTLDSKTELEKTQHILMERDKEIETLTSMVENTSSK
jgi:CheY-like chemotaxis protein